MAGYNKGIIRTAVIIVSFVVIARTQELQYSGSKDLTESVSYCIYAYIGLSEGFSDFMIHFQTLNGLGRGCCTYGTTEYTTAI